MENSIPDITTKYMNGKTLEAFASELGINVSRQSVQQWKEGKHKPHGLMLFKVIGSATATAEAKEWARECLNALTGFELEPTLDAEVERRR